MDANCALGRRSGRKFSKAEEVQHLQTEEEAQNQTPGKSGAGKRFVTRAAEIALTEECRARRIPVDEIPASDRPNLTIAEETSAGMRGKRFRQHARIVIWGAE